ncbi:MAG: hypothetical protein V3W02_01440, partial [Gammaproteobacteria bacterium]
GVSLRRMDAHPCRHGRIQVAVQAQQVEVQARNRNRAPESRQARITRRVEAADYPLTRRYAIL